MSTILIKLKISPKAHLIIGIKWNSFAEDFNFKKVMNEVLILIINVIEDMINLNNKDN